VPEEGQGPNLRFGHDDQSNCRCHFDGGVGYPHPVGVEPSQEMRERMPASFPLQDGKVTCSTCHEVAEQCRIRPSTRSFLRDAPYSQTKDMCYRCHEVSHYGRRDPHLQLTESGDLIEASCLFCHVTVPDTESGTFEDVTFVADLELLCRRCHRQGPFQRHPGGVQHHVRPSPKLLARIGQLEAEHGALMPLTELGKLTCVTCHNPHQRGVIPDSRPSAAGAGELHRHRIQNICTQCHTK
jgi:hypothetical protein